MPTVILSGERNTAELPVAVNGRIQIIPAGEPTLVDDEIFEALQASSAEFCIADEESGSEGGVSSEPLSEPEAPAQPVAKKRVRKSSSKKAE